MWLTIKEVAEALDTTTTKVRRLVKDNALGKVRHDGAKLYVHVEAVRKYATDLGEPVLHRKLCIQNHVFLYRTEFAGDIMRAFARAATRMKVQITHVKGKERALAMLGFYKPRITIAPFSKLGRIEKKVLEEFCPRLHDADIFDRRQVWTVVCGRPLVDLYAKQRQALQESAKMVIESWRSVE